MFYHFRETRLKSPGAYNYAFTMLQELPILRRGGPGVPRFQCMNPYQPPQYEKTLRLALVGYGGITAGQIYGTPLSDNPLGLPPRGGLG